MKIPIQAKELFDQGKLPLQIDQEGICVYSAQGDGAARRTLYFWFQLYQSGDYELVEYRPDMPDLVVTSITDPLLESVFTFIKDTPRSVTDIANKLDISPQKAQSLLDQMRDQGYTLSENRQKVSIRTDDVTQPNSRLDGFLANNGKGTEFSIAVPSDLHVGSKKQQITALRLFCQTARDMGVQDFLMPGDLFAGIGIYRGQENELYAALSEHQEEAALRTVPIDSSDRWYMIGGNHDYAWVKNKGVNLIWRFCQRFENVKYLGYSAADVPLTDRLTARLWHPSGGVPYAKSWRVQKGMEALLQEELERAIRDRESPDGLALFIGHLHIKSLLTELSYIAGLMGCFEGKSLYLKEKGYTPSIGGYIFHFRVQDNGLIPRVDITNLSYPEIEHDYKNYDLDFTYLDAPDQMEVLFSASAHPAA